MMEAYAKGQKVSGENGGGGGLRGVTGVRRTERRGEGGKKEAAAAETNFFRFSSVQSMSVKRTRESSENLCSDRELSRRASSPSY